MARRFTRRQILRWGVAGGAAAALPDALWGCGDDDHFAVRPSPTPTVTPTPVPASFLRQDEKRVAAAVAARLMPSDDTPGAIEAGVPQYIDRLLDDVPTEDAPNGSVFAGGPFSGRNPFPDRTTGTASTNFPPDNFKQFIPLTRLQLLSWRVRLLGSAAVTGADFNDGVLAPAIGLRDQYRIGIAEIQSKSQEMFGAEFTVLTALQQDTVFDAIDPDFHDLMIHHVIEGMFSAPEYGGNIDHIGWNLVQYDGDSQPLGYSIFDETTMSYRERPDKPTSTANPGENFGGVDKNTERFLQNVARGAGGGPHFPT